MSEFTKFINRWFKTATKNEISDKRDELILTEFQDIVYNLFYIKGFDIEPIVDILADNYNIHCSRSKVDKELKAVRDKFKKLKFT